MDILGIGPLELVLILVVALLVFGPDKLPEIGAKLGKGVRELRQLSREISQGVNTLTEPVDELRKPFDDAAQVARQVSSTAESLRNPGQLLQNSLNQQLTAASADPKAEENTIAPPRSPEPVEPVDALAAPGSAAEDPAESVPTVVPPAADSAPAAAVDTSEDMAGNTVADAPATESPSPVSER